MLPPILYTERYIIKPYTSKDEDRFVEMALDEVSVRFMGGSSGIEAEERTLFKTIFSLYESKKPRWFWLWGVFNEEGIACAHLELKETEHTNSDELLVYMVHPNERRKGLMTEVLACLKQHQKEWGRKIIATVGPENENSVKLLERWGIEEKEDIADDETGGVYWKVRLV